ncbi:MAG: DUF2249 domain-containing protein [Chitinophagaceae bacterium]|nr:DUF2249 domain-containing protein [Chitinophagaceae bacterium]
MVINERTKIGTILKHHPDALETIVALSPDFKKLRNPILRKLAAGRATIAMASKMGGCKPEDFFRALAPLGFEVDDRPLAAEETPENKPIPDYLKSLKLEQVVNFDVREILAAGSDPLKQIQQKVKALQPDEVLLIVNSFEPVPLIKLLERQGFETYVKHIDKDTVETWFYKTGQNKDTGSSTQLEAEEGTSGDWDQVLNHYEGKLQEIDVRHLEMPMPMMTILEALESMPEDKALYVHHKRIPVFLLTELKERNFDYRIKEVQDNEVYLLIFKNK